MHGHDVWPSEALHIAQDFWEFAVAHEHRIVLREGDGTDDCCD